MRVGTYALISAALLVAGPRAVRADREESLKHYRAASEHYENGRYAEAARRFREAYAAHPAPEYLYNLAQTYRHLGEREPALEHYRRYLAEAEEGKARRLARRHAEALARKCGAEAGEARDPEESPPPPAGEERSAGSSALMEPAAPAAGERRRLGQSAVGGDTEPRPGLQADAALGGVLYDIGSVEVPVVVSMRAGLSVVLPGDDVRWSTGVALEVSPMRYRDATAGTAYLVSPHLRLGGAVQATPGLWVGAELGAGVLALAGLADGNPFTAEGMAAGTPVLPAARITLGASYELSPRLRVTLAPLILSYAARHEKLAADIDQILGAGASLGLRYSN